MWLKAAIAAAVFSCAGRAVSLEAWFDPAWEFRRAVDITPTGAKVSGAETGVVAFHTAGKALPDKSDIRVTYDGAFRDHPGRAGRFLPRRLQDEAAEGGLLRVVWQSESAAGQGMGA
jgi:hypothetical protein